MALTNCRECSGQVSTEALVCPHCGAPLRPVRYPKFGFEWKSERTFLGYPLIHIAIGRNPEGKLLVAKGIIAIGQFAFGLITVAQFGVGLLFGFGQFVTGLTVLAQFAGGLLLGIGQFATGYAALGQIFLAYYGLGQLGLAKFAWTSSRHDPAAVQFFQSWWGTVKHFFN